MNTKLYAYIVEEFDESYKVYGNGQCLGSGFNNKDVANYKRNVKKNKLDVDITIIKLDRQHPKIEKVSNLNYEYPF